MTASENPSIAISESRTLVIKTNVSASDAGAIATTDTAFTAVSFNTADTSALTITDDSTLYINLTKSATEATSITITESTNVADLLPRQPNVYVGGAWVAGVIKVYHNWGWNTFPIRIYKEGIWT
jgi:hypothetical protein